MKRKWFSFFLLVGLGLATTLMVSLLAAQAGYAGPIRPLRLLLESDVQHAIFLSMGCATAAALLALLLAIPSAYALARWRFPGRVLIDALLDIPIILSPIALGLSLLLVFRSSPGSWIETHLMRFVFEVPGIILAQFILALALATRVLKATFEDVDLRLEQVARFLGCTQWQAFRRVTLPLSRSGLIAAFILGWARAIGDFGATVTLAGSVKGKTETIPTSINLSMNSMKLELAVALMLLMTAMAIIVLVCLRLVNRRRI